MDEKMRAPPSTSTVPKRPAAGPTEVGQARGEPKKSRHDEHPSSFPTDMKIVISQPVPTSRTALADVTNAGRPLGISAQAKGTGFQPASASEHLRISSLQDVDVDPAAPVALGVGVTSPEGAGAHPPAGRPGRPSLADFTFTLPPPSDLRFTMGSRAPQTQDLVAPHPDAATGAPLLAPLTTGQFPGIRKGPNDSWFARVSDNRVHMKVSHWLGPFGTPEEAAYAFDAGLRILGREDKCIFPPIAPGDDERFVAAAGTAAAAIPTTAALDDDACAAAAEAVAAAAADPHFREAPVIVAARAAEAAVKGSARRLLAAGRFNSYLERGGKMCFGTVGTRRMCWADGCMEAVAHTRMFPAGMCSVHCQGKVTVGGVEVQACPKCSAVHLSSECDGNAESCIVHEELEKKLEALRRAYADPAAALPPTRRRQFWYSPSTGEYYVNKDDCPGDGTAIDVDDPTYVPPQKTVNRRPAAPYIPFSENLVVFSRINGAAGPGCSTDSVDQALSKSGEIKGVFITHKHLDHLLRMLTKWCAEGQCRGDFRVIMSAELKRALDHLGWETVGLERWNTGLVWGLEEGQMYRLTDENGVFLQQPVAYDLPLDGSWSASAAPLPEGLYTVAIDSNHSLGSVSWNNVHYFGGKAQLEHRGGDANFSDTVERKLGLCVQALLQALSQSKVELFPRLAVIDVTRMDSEIDENLSNVAAVKAAAEKVGGAVAEHGVGKVQVIYNSRGDSNHHHHLRPLLEKLSSPDAGRLTATWTVLGANKDQYRPGTGLSTILNDLEPEALEQYRENAADSDLLMVEHRVLGSVEEGNKFLDFLALPDADRPADLYPGYGRREEVVHVLCLQFSAYFRILQPRERDGAAGGCSVRFEATRISDHSAAYGISRYVQLLLRLGFPRAGILALQRECQTDFELKFLGRPVQMGDIEDLKGVGAAFMAARTAALRLQSGSGSGSSVAASAAARGAKKPADSRAAKKPADSRAAERKPRAPFWTPEEDSAVINAVGECGYRWSEINRRFGGESGVLSHRSADALRKRWEVLEKMNPAACEAALTASGAAERKKNPAASEAALTASGAAERKPRSPDWTPEEDNALINGVGECGYRWSEIHRKFGGESGVLSHRSADALLKRWARLEKNNPAACEAARKKWDAEAQRRREALTSLATAAAALLPPSSSVSSGMAALAAAQRVQQPGHGGLSSAATLAGVVPPLLAEHRAAAAHGSFQQPLTLLSGMERVNGVQSGVAALSAPLPVAPMPGQLPWGKLIPIIGPKSWEWSIPTAAEWKTWEPMYDAPAVPGLPPLPNPSRAQLGYWVPFRGPRPSGPMPPGALVLPPTLWKDQIDPPTAYQPMPAAATGAGAAPATAAPAAPMGP